MHVIFSYCYSSNEEVWTKYMLYFHTAIVVMRRCGLNVCKSI